MPVNWQEKGRRQREGRPHTVLQRKAPRGSWGWRPERDWRKLPADRLPPSLSVCRLPTDPPILPSCHSTKRRRRTQSRQETESLLCTQVSGASVCLDWEARGLGTCFLSLGALSPLDFYSVILTFSIKANLFRKRASTVEVTNFKSKNPVQPAPERPVDGSKGPDFPPFELHRLVPSFSTCPAPVCSVH